MEREGQNWKKWLPLLFGLVMAVGMLIGFRLQQSVQGKRSIDKIFNSASHYKINDVIEYIDTRYVDTVDKDELYESTINEILSDLDPHSSYISAKNMVSVNESMEGKFEGIGVEFFIVNDTITIVSPISGGPSEQLGILAGDKIITIEDSVIAGIGIKNRDVMKLLRGPKGSKVNIEIKRGNSDELIAYTIKRDKIPIVSVDVSFLLEDNVGYIKINRFNDNTHNEFRKQLIALKEKKMTKLVLDLRQNPGGILQEATKIADEFIGGKKVLVYTEGRAVEKYEYKANNKGEFEKGNLIVLIDGGSASASEILAGAIQDLDRGKIIGRRSFGKGLVQEQKILDDGSALRLTIARYYIPSGRSIQRNYDKGADKYYEEITDRIESGNKEDTIDTGEIEKKDRYYTHNGREVFGGGGIRPDIIVEIDSTYLEKDLVSYLNKLPNFIYDYYANNTDKFSAYKTADEFNDDYNISRVYNKFVDGKSLSSDIESELKNRLKAYLAKQLFKEEGYYKVMVKNDDEVQRALQEFRDPSYSLVGN